MGEMIKQLPDVPETGQVIVQNKILSNWLWFHNPLYGLGISDIARKEFCSSSQGGKKIPKPEYFLQTRKGGRCEDCQGKGEHTVSLDFLGQNKIECLSCDGTGFCEEAREIKSHGLSFDELLDMPLESIYDSGKWPGIQSVLGVAVEMGLGYLKAGQNGNRLSPGEKQRLMLVRDLCSGGKERKIYLLDEPTRGLHHKDTSKFIILVKRLIEMGHSIVMVEHHPELIISADWTIELGPGGGPKGGEMIYSGPPAGMIEYSNSPTGKVLKGMS